MKWKRKLLNDLTGLAPVSLPGVKSVFVLVLVFFLLVWRKELVTISEVEDERHAILPPKVVATAAVEDERHAILPPKVVATAAVEDEQHAILPPKVVATAGVEDEQHVTLPPKVVATAAVEDEQHAMLPKKMLWSVVTEAKTPEEWAEFARHDFSSLATQELNPWANDCSVQRRKNKFAKRFTEDLLNKLASGEKQLSREELVKEAGAWTEHECPSAVDYFSNVAYFDIFPEFADPPEEYKYPISTTAFALRATCLLKITERIMHDMLNSTMLLVAGAHLGAVRSGGVIPWDDDVDVFVPYKHMEEILQRCASYRVRSNSSRIRCSKYNNAVKIFMEDETLGPTAFKPKGRPYQSPYIDVFLYNENVEEVWTSGTLHNTHLVHQLRPIRPWLFGGETFLGPPRENSVKKFNLSYCLMTHSNHRLEIKAKKYKLDCCVLRGKFPFSYTVKFYHVGQNRTLHLEQTVLQSKVLSATVLSEEGVVERMFTVDASGQLKQVPVPLLRDVDP